VARIDAFLKLGAAQGCSDVHLAVGVPPMLRMNGDLMPIKFRNLGSAELESLVTEILGHHQREQFEKGDDVDFSYVAEDGNRFRVNVFHKDTGVGAVFRTIPTEVPTLDSLRLPAMVKKFCDFHQGMVLVTGSTGTGKSTTLAAMIDHLNRTRRLNIVSLEDPIEFVHRSKMSQVIQRELHTHLPRGVTDDASADVLVERSEEMLDRYAPGWRDLVIDRWVQRPSDLFAADANLVGGGVNGGTAQLYQQLFFRPVTGLGGPRTPVDGLYLGSAAIHPGGGVHGACGYLAARQALLDHAWWRRPGTAVAKRLRRRLEL